MPGKKVSKNKLAKSKYKFNIDLFGYQLDHSEEHLTNETIDFMETEFDENSEFEENIINSLYNKDSSIFLCYDLSDITLNLNDESIIQLPIDYLKDISFPKVQKPKDGLYISHSWINKGSVSTDDILTDDLFYLNSLRVIVNYMNTISETDKNYIINGFEYKDNFIEMDFSSLESRGKGSNLRIVAVRNGKIKDYKIPQTIEGLRKIVDGYNKSNKK